MRRLKPGNIMCVVTDRLVQWARRDPRRLLGADDVAALFYRLLVLSNTHQQLQHLSHTSASPKVVSARVEQAHGEQLDEELALKVCLVLLDPKIAIAQAFDGKVFVRSGLESVARLVLGTKLYLIRLAGLKLIAETIVAWGKAGQIGMLTGLLGNEALDWPSVLLSVMHDATGEDEVLGLALSTLTIFLSSAVGQTRHRFAVCGGYAAIEDLLCRRHLSLHQQRACTQTLLKWLTYPPTTSNLPHDEKKDAHFKHLLLLVLRVVEVCQAQVRLEAVGTIKAFVSSPKAAMRVAAVSDWADLLLNLVQGIGGLGTGQASGGDAPTAAPSTKNEQVVTKVSSASAPEQAAESLYDHITQVIACVVEQSLRHGEGGWIVLRDSLAALSRLRLLVPGGHVEDLDAGKGAREGGLERQLADSARMLLGTSIKTLQQLVASMIMWDASASFVCEGAAVSLPPGAVAGATLGSKDARYVRDEVAGLLVLVHVFLLSAFTEEQRSLLMALPTHQSGVSNASGANASSALLLLRALRTHASVAGADLQGASEGGGERGGRGVWVDKAIVSEVLDLLHTLTSLPRAPLTLSLEHLCIQEEVCSQDADRQVWDAVLDARSWAAASFFLSMVLLHDVLGHGAGRTLPPLALPAADMAPLGVPQDQEMPQDQQLRMADDMRDRRTEVLMVCHTLVLSCACACQNEAATDGNTLCHDAYPWASFAVCLSHLSVCLSLSCVCLSVSIMCVSNYLPIFLCRALSPPAVFASLHFRTRQDTQNSLAMQAIFMHQFGITSDTAQKVVLRIIMFIDASLSDTDKHEIHSRMIYMYVFSCICTE